MICKLTGKEGTSAKAHIIPKSFYFIDKTSNTPLKLVTNAKDVYPRKSWTGIYDDKIVTQEGEKIFSEWDDYAFKLLIEQDISAKPLKHEGSIFAYMYDNYNYEKLKLFFLSVLWRAGASSQAFFKRVNLGPHLEILRKAIINSNPGDSHFYTTALALFDDKPSWAKIMDPFPTRFDNIKFYTFYMGNIVVYIKVDKQKSRAPLREVRLVPNRPLFLIKRRFLGSNEQLVMQKIIKNMNS
ncbi:MAG: hypothetical protein GY797_04175 [Deltaproteobacteria bacterium]|nr:hypothetical protein [Deltaproteobacteria bacterium]